MPKLIKYSVTPSTLTLTFLLENGEEMVVTVSCPTIANQMAVDIANLIYEPDYATIHKITRHIDLEKDTVIFGDDDTEEEGDGNTD